MTVVADAFKQSRLNARAALLAARTPGGWWEGELSSSALSTATAVFALNLLLNAAEKLPADQEHAALAAFDESRIGNAISNGLNWLALHQNPDGGWGDTTKSFSNISTTALCWAALAIDSRSTHPAYSTVTVAAERWLTTHAGGIEPAQLVPAIIKRYGKDHTFSVPILTMCALAGRLGPEPTCWRKIPQLPFELAAFPQRWFKRLRLPVVSYALPALIAIGLVRHVRRAGWNIAWRAVRNIASERAMRLLQKIQPTGGGFLEATPLTSFVVMSLVGAGELTHPVVRQGVSFLLNSMRSDGSWPIDTNLATWVTTLSINALGNEASVAAALPESDRRRLTDWLLDQQYRVEHPYTLADPGGWAWTPLPGGVPDADDTPGALIALRKLNCIDNRVKQAAEAGIRWLLDLQNSDGGIPTFCRGWGRLPFDRSSADLTAHTLRAIADWVDLMPAELARRARKAAGEMISYLDLYQFDGAWTPLWFGNQHVPDDVNPTYGTARVLLAASSVEGPDWSQCIARGVDWLLSAQRHGGGWGAGHDSPASIEETSLAIEALCEVRKVHGQSAAHGLVELIDASKVDSAIERGINYLCIQTDRGTKFDPTPIGFYFAKLWYFEKLYPLIFSAAAFESAVQNP